MENLVLGQSAMAIPLKSPMVQDVLQKLNSIGADFVWIFAVYEEQKRINKELKDEITNVSASHELLRQTYDLAEQKITSLESRLYNSCNDTSDSYTEVSLESSTREKIKDQQDQISYLVAESRRVERRHKAEMAAMAEITTKYEEALAHMSALVAAGAKKIAELEAGGESQTSDLEMNKCEEA
ncbi:uncharacterized protein PV09_09775 [Verruconis gallopava]|uniref:Uncharacterized protein n=1 Tax=Verruconis gallopava TaxID=253628 RepID=A0A0D1ZV60_9PEZI|nr:uncharacterized protein PV09_09775 [Verruconis gallopava]KIV98392.1 hypothetical protein PV09_09775 [Verruconis gallopava]